MVKSKVKLRVKVKTSTAKPKLTVKSRAKPKPIPKLKTKVGAATGGGGVDDVPLLSLSTGPSPIGARLYTVCDLRKERGLVDDINRNEKITGTIQQLINVTKKLKAACEDSKLKRSHQYRINSFTRALEIIRGHPTPITSSAQAMKLPGVGKGIGDRITEILKTGTLAELVKIESSLDPGTHVLTDLCSITGIGEARARTLRDKYGVTGVKDLINKYECGLIKVAKN